MQIKPGPDAWLSLAFSRRQRLAVAGTATSNNRGRAGRG
jgi:hypothetical protein